MLLENIRLGIFDHSGVLSDDRLPVYEANMFLSEKYGVAKIGFEEWLRASKASAGDLILSFGVDVPKEEIDKEYERVYTEIVTRKDKPIKPTLYPDVPEVLRLLREEKGLKLAVVSNHPKLNLVRELEEGGIIRLFDEISGDPTPKTERLKLICGGFQIPTRESFFVEDTVYGLRSGHQAGVNCFGVTTGYHSRERLEVEGIAVAVIDSLSELLEYL